MPHIEVTEHYAHASRKRCPFNCRLNNPSYLFHVFYNTMVLCFTLLKIL